MVAPELEKTGFFEKVTIDGPGFKGDEKYKQSKVSLIYLVKRYIETCLYLLGIKSVERT